MVALSKVQRCIFLDIAFLHIDHHHCEGFVQEIGNISVDKKSLFIRHELILNLLLQGKGCRICGECGQSWFFRASGESFC